MGKFHRLLNWPKKVHHYVNPTKCYRATIWECEYCEDVFFTGNRDDVPFGIGAKYPDEECTRSRI